MGEVGGFRYHLPLTQRRRKIECPWRPVLVQGVLEGSLGSLVPWWWRRCHLLPLKRLRRELNIWGSARVPRWVLEISQLEVGGVTRWLQEVLQEV